MKENKATEQDGAWARLIPEEKAEALEAVKRYRKRTRKPGPNGRPSKNDLVKEAIKKVAHANGGTSGINIKPWSQDDWADKIQKALPKKLPKNKLPKKVTTLKHFKAYVRRTPVPLHLLPFSLEWVKPLSDQFTCLYCEALVEASRRASRNNSARFTIDFLVVDALHRELCAEHILRSKLVKPFTETERRAWLIDQWNRTKSVPLQPRKS